MNERLFEVNQQIKELESERDSLKEAEFKKASKHWFTLLHAQYESASYRTPQYLTFCRVFKRQFTKLLKESFDIKRVEIKKPNHFDSGGFFELQNGTIFYFSIGDLRWSKCFLIRTAEHFKDYSGGINRYCAIDRGYDEFVRQLKEVVKFESRNS